MKHIRLMLSLIACAQGLYGMNNVRLGEARIAQAVQRLQLKDAYEKLRQEMRAFSELPLAEQAARKNTHLKIVDERFMAIETMESLDKAQSAKMTASHRNFATQFKTAIRDENVSLELFEKVLLSSVAAEGSAAQTAGKRSGAAQAEVKHEADATAQTAGSAAAQETTSAQRSSSSVDDFLRRRYAGQQDSTQDDLKTAAEARAASADQKSGAAAAAEKPAGDKAAQSGQKEGQVPVGSSITDEDVMQVGAGAIIYQSAWVLAGIAKTGGKWALKGSNPALAAAVTAAETYQLYCWWQRRKTRKS